MKNSFLKYFVLLALTLSIVFALGSCALIESLLPGTEDDGPTVCTHADDDGDGICDKCGDAYSSGDGDGTPTEAPSLDGVVFEDKTVTYNGTYQSIEVDPTTVPEGITVMHSTNRFMNAGEYTVTADFYFAGAKLEGKSRTATLTINKADYSLEGVTLIGLTKIYDGVAVEPEIEGKLPSGVSVSYVIKNAADEEVNEIVDAGIYTVWAVFSGDKTNYHEMTPISATVEIRRARVTGISFKDASFDYDGEAKYIYASGVPSFVEVNYTGNGQTAVGKYTVVASFNAGPNYEAIADMTAELEIRRLVADMSGVSLLGSSVTYDGKDKMPALVGELPVGVSASVVATNEAGDEVTELINVGVYTVTATFSAGDEYEPIAPITVTVTIGKASVADLVFSDALFYFDNKAKTVSVVGELPDDVDVDYVITNSLGEIVSEMLEIGSYTVVASFTVTDNYESIDDMTAKVEIVQRSFDMTGITLPSSTSSYNGASQLPEFTGELPDGLTALVTVTDALGNKVDDAINVGTYTVTATFEVPEFYAPVAPMTATVVITKASFGGLEFKDAQFNYDGAEKSIFVSGVPSFVEVTYVGNGKVSPGEYKVVATFAASDNYEAIPEMTATMTITLGDPLDNPTKTLTYEKVSGGYAVSGITDAPTIVVIPATYLGESVIEIKSNAFRGMSGLEFVYIPETVERIGNAAFMDCASLETAHLADFSVTVGDDGELVTTGSSALKIIGQRAFAGTAIKKIDLPDSITVMGSAVFEGCDKLEKLTVPFIGGSLSSTSHPFIGYLFGADMAEAQQYSVPASLTEVIVSNNCTEIPAYAFKNLSSLKSVHVGQSVTKIGNGAFENCSGIRDIYLPVSVVAIPANASPENSPFYGCADDFMIVIEDVGSTGEYGRYYNFISDEKSALVVLNKSYKDYVMNKESFRVADPSDSGAAAIFYDGNIIEGFSTSVLEYTVDVDINVGIREFTALLSSSLASYTVSVEGTVATVTVVSQDKTSTTTYKINCKVSSDLNADAEVVNKNGADATVSFVVDDGFIGTAEFCKSMLDKYPSLALTFAIYTRKFATLKTEDPDGDGIYDYVMDEDGKYTYDVDMYLNGDESQGTVVDFWRDILASTPGRTEIVSHSHTHQYWGYNDNGGSMFALNTSNKMSKSPTTVARGSVTAEMYASIQIINDLFGDLGSDSKTFVIPGIAARGGTAQLAVDTTILLRGHVVRLTADTAVSVDGSGEMTVNSATEIDLTSVKLTIPAGTPISTTVAYENNVIPAGSVIKVVECSMVVPAGTTIMGHGTYWTEIKDKAFDELLYVGSRNTGAAVKLNGGIYNESFFANPSKRKEVKSFGISTKEINYDASEWKGYIDSAVEMKGWVSYCIHAITDTLDSDIENQGGHMITKVQGEALFNHAVEYGDRLWIANYTDATLYYHEWSTSTVASTYDHESSSLTVSLTDKEDDSVYNMALTVKVQVPATWSVASCGEDSLEIRRNGDGSAYVLVDVVPETSVVISGK